MQLARRSEPIGPQQNTPTCRSPCSERERESFHWHSYRCFSALLFHHSYAFYHMVFTFSHSILSDFIPLVLVRLVIAQVDHSRDLTRACCLRKGPSAGGRTLLTTYCTLLCPTAVAQRTDGTGPCWCWCWCCCWCCCCCCSCCCC